MAAPPPAAPAAPPAYPPAVYPGYAYPGYGGVPPTGYPPPMYPPPAFWYPPPRQAKAGNMIDGTFRVWGKRFLDFFAIFAIQAVIVEALTILLTWLTFGVPSLLGNGIGITTPGGAFDIGAFVLVLLAVYLATPFIGALFLGAATWIAYHTQRGEATTLGASFRESSKRVGNLMVSSFLISLVLLATLELPNLLVVIGAFSQNLAEIGLGFLFELVGVPICIYLILGLGLFPSTVMFEGAGGVNALGKSWALARGRKVSFFGAGTPIFIIAIILEVVPPVVAAFLLLGGGSTTVVAVTVVTIVGQGLGGGLLAILSAVGYTLIQKDEQTARQYMGGTAPPPPMTPAPMASPAAPPAPPAAPPFP